MAMMITKFHRLIQNKLVWIVFSLMVVISFVFWGMQSPNDDGAYEAQAPGTLNGKPISAEEFYQSEFGSYFRLMLQSGQRIPYTSDVKERLGPLAWKRLASLKTAEKLGLVATRDEIRINLENTEFLSPNGQFDPAQYDMFINQALPNLLGGRISKQQFEDHVRREISLGKLMAMVENTVLVPPTEVRQIFHTLNDTLSIEYTLINAENVEDQVEVTDEQIQAYYDENPDVFEIPERVAIRYISIPVDSFLDDVTVEEDSVRDYYAANPDEFQVIPTNEIPVTVGSETNDVSTALAITNRPFDEVREEIHAKLLRDKAQFKAVEQANVLVYALTPDQYGNAPTFDEETTAMGLEIHEVEPFTRYQPVAAFDADADKVQEQAFQLFDNPDEYFSNPVDAGDTVYVLALKERLDPEIPPFEDVAEQARPYARRAAVSDAMRSLGEKVAADVSTAEPSETRFSAVVELAGLTSTNLGPISAVSGGEALPSASTVMEALIGLNAGEVSEPLLTDQGLMVAYVLERTPATDADFELGREQLAGDLRSQYAIAMFDAWQQQLLDDAEFTPREDTAEDEEEAASEDEGAAAPDVDA